MINPICRMCNKELEDFGGLLISPPLDDFCNVSSVIKSHLCKPCYYIITDFIKCKCDSN